MSEDFEELPSVGNRSVRHCTFHFAMECQYSMPVQRQLGLIVVSFLLHPSLGV